MPPHLIYDPIIKEQAENFPRFDVSDVTGSRAVLKAYIDERIANGATAPSDARVEEIERTIPGPKGAPDVRIRIYMPKDRSQDGPGYINFHGGGFVLGDLESEHARCLLMAAKGGAVAIDVDYRLAPENPFPAALEDGYATLLWVSQNAQELKIAPTRLAIGGISAGGNLATAIARMSRDHNGPNLAFQMLFYPALDDRCDTQSMAQGDNMYIWDTQNSRDMWDHYIGKNRDNVSPYAAPARAENLDGLPPAYVMTCEHDPLRDEGLIYAMRLMAAGVPTEIHNYPGTIHGFDFLTPSAISTRAVNDGIEIFKRAMSA
jgi:acetyl esterase